MARSHGRLLARIWSDAEFRALTSSAQRAYMLLLSQANLTHAGTIPLTVRRWAALASDVTEADMIEALRELEQRRFVVIDGTTEELLVRTLIRNDGVYKQPKVFTSAKNDALMIASRKLRRALVKELFTLPIENAEVESTCKTLIEGLSDPDPEPPETQRDTPDVPNGIPQAMSPCSASGGSPTPAPLPSHSPPVAEISKLGGTVQQRADVITKSYHQRLNGMTKFVSVLGIVKTAIKAETWSDREIHDALMRLADEDRPLTTETLRIECNGLRPRASPTSIANKATQRTQANLALVAQLEAEQERGA